MKIFSIVLLTAGMLFAPVSGLLADGGKAHIITQNQKPAECIAAVAITEIDGRLKRVPEQGFKIEAGQHSMNGRAFINTSNCPVIRGRDYYSVPDLEANFEAGKRYYVGLDHSSRNKEDWRLVIWKVE